MKNSTKLLGMTAAVALLSAPAMAGYKDDSTKYNKLNESGKSTFSRIDTNRDGRITMNEFENNTMHDNEVAVFKMFDQNDDGIVTRAELENNSKMGGDKVNSAKQAGTRTNFKTKTGSYVGSMDAKFYNGTPYIDNPFYDDPELANDIDVNIDNPFKDDPEIADKYDTNWEWPETINRNKPLFPQLDADANGYITQDEFMAGTQHNNEAEVFAMLDKSQNGGIDKKEFKKFSKMGGLK